MLEKIKKKYHSLWHISNVLMQNYVFHRAAASSPFEMRKRNAGKLKNEFTSH
jgi:hypothetical protein